MGSTQAAGWRRGSAEGGRRRTRMQIGFNLPLSGPFASSEMLARLALEGERLGFDYIALSDHIVEPINISARYPYSEGGEYPQASRGERHEQLTTLAYLAGKTSRIRFLT